MTLRVALPLLCSFTAGCMTGQSYEGERREPEEVARISGDMRVTAGAPVTVILRQVDGRTLSIGENAVEVLPGSHTLLVDCRIAETGGVSRHTIEAEVSEGRRYRLVAETAPGLRECAAVHVQALD
jgi:hypothetical protein